MLLLLLRNMMWAAWWPYATMLLALEKAAQQREREAPRPQAQSAQRQRPSDPPPQPAQVHPRESVMGNDGFMKPEIPEPLREMMKLGIAQAQRAFEVFISTSEKAWKSLENTSPLGRAGLFALNAKIAEITRRNAEAHFALVMRLAEAKDLPHALELQNRHMQQQMDVFVKQLEEMRDLTAHIVQEAAHMRGDVSTLTPSASDTARNAPASAQLASYARPRASRPAAPAATNLP
jgi:hypothetical protein